MMIELKNIDLWHRSVDAISYFISEGNFRFNDNGISFKAMDPSQIVLVEYEMPKSAFDKFDIESNYAGVDLVELARIMSRALPEDKMLMDLNDSEMLIKFDGTLERSFKLPLLDISDDEIKTPKHTPEATVEIESRIMKEALKDASLFGSSVVLKVKGKQFFVEARGSGGVLNTVSKNSGVKVTSSKEIVSKYSLNFLQNIVKEAEVGEKITMELKTDAPMKVSYKIGKSDIKFYLAHMIL